MTTVEDKTRLRQPQETPSLFPLPPFKPQPQGQSPHEHNSHHGDSSSVLSGFPYSLVMEVRTSEPRDALQSERTCLTFIRFAVSLFFSALGIILNFKFETSGTPSGHAGFNRSTYSTVASYILLALALSVLLISAINYFVTIRRYASHKIHTYNFNNMSTVICMTCIFITLMGICISLIVEGYLEGRGSS